MEGVERYKVRLLPHNPEWKKEFYDVKKEIENLWKDNVITIEHFGSTAIEGIYAKPILDVAVVVKSFQNMDIEVMKNNGYSFCGLQAPNYDRYLFVLRSESKLSLQHIHCYEQSNDDFIECMKFRDYLINHPDKAKEYSKLKIELAKKFADDRVAYANGKESFIKSLME